MVVGDEQGGGVAVRRVLAQKIIKLQHVAVVARNAPQVERLIGGVGEAVGLHEIDEHQPGLVLRQNALDGLQGQRIGAVTGTGAAHAAVNGGLVLVFPFRVKGVGQNVQLVFAADNPGGGGGLAGGLAPQLKERRQPRQLLVEVVDGLVDARGQGHVPGIGVGEPLVVEVGKEHAPGPQLGGHVGDEPRHVAPGFGIPGPVDDHNDDVLGAQRLFGGRRGKSREHKQPQPQATPPPTGADGQAAPPPRNCEESHGVKLNNRAICFTYFNLTI